MGGQAESADATRAAPNVAVAGGNRNKVEAPANGGIICGLQRRAG